MDVGLVVSFSGLIAAAFALLASVALAVELGVAPGKKSGKNKDAKDDKTVQQTTNSKRSKGKSPDTPNQNSTDNSNDNSLQQTNFDTVRATESGGMEELLAAQQNSSAESISNLQRSYVDGLLGHRKKYDVALAILNEYQTTDVSEEDKGLLMATQAYLSATRTGSLSSGSHLLGGGDKSILKKQTTEIARPDDTTEATTAPNKKTGERRRPPSRSNLSKKTTTGDEPKPGTARNTKRNTRS